MRSLIANILSVPITGYTAQQTWTFNFRTLVLNLVTTKRNILFKLLFIVRVAYGSSFLFLNRHFQLFRFPFRNSFVTTFMIPAIFADLPACICVAI